MTNIIRAIFEPNKYTAIAARPDSKPIYQYNYGQILQIHGLGLQKAVEIHFAHSMIGGDAIIRIGTTTDKITEVAVPEKFLETSGTVTAYIYVSDTESGQTEYKIQFQIAQRAKPEAWGSPEDGELFREAIEAVNESAEKAEDAAVRAEEASATAQESARAATEQAEKAKSNLETAISNANTAKGELDDTIADAGTSKTNLSDTIAAAETKRSEVQGVINTGNTLQATLTEQNTAAGNNLAALQSENFNSREILTGVDDIKANIDDFKNSTFNAELVGKTKNLLNWGEISKDKIISSDGSLVTNNLRWTTDFIPLTDKNRSIISSFLFTSSSGIQSRRERTWTHMACYDDNRKYIDGTYLSVAMSKYTANDETIKLIRLSYNPTQVGNVETDFYLMLEYGTSVNTNLDDYVPYNAGYYAYYLKENTINFLNDKVLRKKIEINSSDGITEFYNRMLKAFIDGNYDVYIKGGEYRYTNEIIEKIRADGRRGVPIGNDCRYYFETGANLYCEYTGENKSDVYGYFSPLDSQNVGGNFEIHNLDLISKNTCYALHDEANASDDFCKHIYKNCYIELDNTALGANGNSISKALGGGLGKYEEIIIENCVFKAINPSKISTIQDDASYHAANMSTITNAKIIINGCYFEHRFRTSDFSDYPLQSPTPRIIYINNSSGNEANIPSTWNTYKWNNEVRS